MAAPVYVNAGALSSFNANHIQPALPASRVNGNLLVAVCALQRDAVNIHCETDGWRKFGQLNSPGASPSCVAVFTRYVDGTETAPNMVFGGARCVAIVYQYSGASPLNPPIGAYTTSIGTVNPHTSTQITTTQNDSRALYLDGNLGGALDQPTGWTENSDTSTSRGGIVIGGKDIATSGTASGNISVTGTNSNWEQYQMELQSPESPPVTSYYVGASVAQSATTSGSPKVVNLPAGRQIGDLIIACVAIGNPGSPGSMATATPGWVKWQEFLSSSGGVALGFGIFTCIVDGTETAPTITFTPGGGSSQWQSYLFRGGEFSNPPFGLTFQSNTGNTSPNSVNGFTTSRKNSCALYFNVNRSGQVIDRPAGWMENVTNVHHNDSAFDSTSITIGSKLIVDAGTASGNISVNGASAQWLMLQLELLGAGVTVEDADLTLTGENIALAAQASVTITLDIAAALSLADAGALELSVSVPAPGTPAALSLTGETITFDTAFNLQIEPAGLTLAAQDIPIIKPTILSIQPAMLTLTGEDVINLSCNCYDTSQSYQFGQHTQIIDIITEAYERCGIDGTLISGTMLDSARRSLEYMFSEWANNGPNLFSVYQYTITLIPGQVSYTLPSNTIYVVNAATRQTINSQVTDLTISGISRAEYLALPNKNQTAQRPTQFYLERTTIPTIYPWPVLQPNTSCEIVTYLLRIQQDITKFCGAVDGPQRAMDAIAAGLAKRLSLKYAKPEFDRLKIESQEAYDLFLREDRERVPYRIVPDASGWSPV